MNWYRTSKTSQLQLTFSRSPRNQCSRGAKLPQTSTFHFPVRNQEEKKPKALLGTLLALDSAIVGASSAVVFVNTKDAAKLLEQKLRTWKFRRLACQKYCERWDKRPTSTG